MLAFLVSLFTLVNAPFTTSLLVVGFSLVFQLLGLLHFGDPEHELASHGEGEAGGHELAEHGGHEAAEGDADGGHDGHDGDGHDGDGHADGHADGDGDGDHDGDHADHSGGRGGVMAFLGVGKVPLAVVWQTLFVMFGLVGITVNTIGAWMSGGLQLWLLAASVPAAIVGGVLLTTGAVRTIARLIPASSGDAASRRQLVGMSGVVISSKITDEFGEVRLKDPEGRTLRLICYTHPGEPPILEGTEVMVTDLDRDSDRLHVTSMDRLIDGKPRLRQLAQAKQQQKQ